VVRGDDGLDEKKARADAQLRAAPLIQKQHIDVRGTRFEGKPSISLDDIGIYQTASEPLAKRLDITLPDDRRAHLVIEEHALGTASCDGFGGRGVPGLAAVRGATLTLIIDGGANTVLHADKKLPPRRRCASGYGIAEAYLYAAPNGALTLAALIEVVDNHDFHAGPNRRFMPVTGRLAK
jgi:hypothetical protein